jgi:predicted metal-dependent phosphoesterase TrpH
MIPRLTAPTFDLQSHSLHSDGALAPAEVVRLAAEAGVELLALSDHDTVDGVEEALAAGAEHGVRMVTAAELSSVDGRHEDLHVLGYGIDHRDPELRERLHGFRADRELRAERMTERLRELGWAVAEGRLEERRRAGKTIGRPHLTMAVLDHPDNAERLAAEGLTDVSAFLPAYLIPGAPAFLPRTTPTVEEAIEVIHAAGGRAVWAHPFWDISEPEEVIGALERFRAFGLDGVEAFYVTHSREETLLLVDHCDRHDLLTTGSADFHGPEHERFSRFLAFELHGREPRLGPLAGY